MDVAWFLYTIIIIIVASAASFTSITVWILTSRKDCLVAAAAFLLYVLEVATILYDEYVRTKPLLNEYFTSGLTHPIINIVFCTLLVVCLWLWVLMRIHVRVKPQHVALCIGIYGILAVLVAPIGSAADKTHTMVYWGLRDCSVLAAFVFALWWRDHRATETDRVSIDRAYKFFTIALVFSVVMLAEDIVNILFMNPEVSGGWQRDFWWHLTERNITENLLMIFCAACMIRYNQGIIQIFSRHPQELSASRIDTTKHRDLESRLLRFSDSFSISQREQEVLRLVVEGKDIQNIASSLYISTGTVKAHLHRIYTKVGVEHRKELINAFWKHT